KLCDNDVGPGVDLALEVLQIDLGRGRLQVFFRVTGHGNAKLRELAGDQRHQFVGIGEAAFYRGECLFAPRRIAPQGHDILDAQVPGFAQVGPQVIDRAAHAGKVRGHRQIELAVYAGDDVERLAPRGATRPV